MKIMGPLPEFPNRGIVLWLDQLPHAGAGAGGGVTEHGGPGPHQAPVLCQGDLASVTPLIHEQVAQAEIL